MPILYPAILKGTVADDETSVEALSNELMLVQKDKIDTDEFSEIRAELLAIINVAGTLHFLAPEGVIEQGVICSLGGCSSSTLIDIIRTSDSVALMDSYVQSESVVMRSKTFTKDTHSRDESVRLRFADMWYRYEKNKRLPVLLDSETIRLTAVQDVKPGDYIVEYKGDMSVFDKHLVDDVSVSVDETYQVSVLLNYYIPEERAEEWKSATNLPLVSMGELIEKHSSGSLELDPNKALYVIFSELMDQLNDSTDLDETDSKLDINSTAVEDWVLSPEEAEAARVKPNTPRKKLSKNKTKSNN